MSPYRSNAYVAPPVQNRRFPFRRFVRRIWRKFLVRYYGGQFVERYPTRCLVHGIHRCSCPTFALQAIRHNIMINAMSDVSKQLESLDIQIRTYAGIAKPPPLVTRRKGKCSKRSRVRTFKSSVAVTSSTGPK